MPSPRSPTPGFPLFPHATRRWAKKILGKLHYFGPWDDPDAALQKYLDQKDDLYAGRVPRAQGDGLTVKDLCINFLTTKKLAQETGQLSARHYTDLARQCEAVAKAFGATRLVSDLHPDDFEQLKVSGHQARAVDRHRHGRAHAQDNLFVPGPRDC